MNGHAHHFELQPLNLVIEDETQLPHNVVHQNGFHAEIKVHHPPLPTIIEEDEEEEEEEEMEGIEEIIEVGGRVHRGSLFRGEGSGGREVLDEVVEMDDDVQGEQLEVQVHGEVLDEVIEVVEEIINEVAAADTQLGGVEMDGQVIKDEVEVHGIGEIRDEVVRLGGERDEVIEGVSVGGRVVSLGGRVVSVGVILLVLIGYFLLGGYISSKLEPHHIPSTISASFSTQNSTLHYLNFRASESSFSIGLSFTLLASTEHYQKMNFKISVEVSDFVLLAQPLPPPSHVEKNQAYWFQDIHESVTLKSYQMRILSPMIEKGTLSIDVYIRNNITSEVTLCPIRAYLARKATKSLPCYDIDRSFMVAFEVLSVCLILYGLGIYRCIHN